MKCQSNKLLPFYTSGVVEAGTDEAGRGCLAGPVFAAAVILPPDYSHPVLNDSKQLSERQRYALRDDILRDALAWAVASCSPQEIDQLNILRASITAMHRALDALTICPQHIIVDGNRFYPYTRQIIASTADDKPSPTAQPIPHHTIVKGDAKYLSIAAASILAKTFRDDEMMRLDSQYPQYAWAQNKGYPSPAHRQAIALYGTTPHHRLTFRLLPEAEQLELPL